MLSLNSAPYFDDYKESSGFHRILFKPGIPVQSRELTQLQTIFQNQISRFGDHMFVNGSRVSGGQVSTNNQVFSVKLIESANVTGIESGTYIRGEVSGLIAEVVVVNQQTTFDPANLIYTVRTRGSNGLKFIDDEKLYFYEDYELVTQIVSPIFAASGTSTQAAVNGIAGYSKLTTSEINKIKVGGYIASLDAYIISVDSSSFKINKELDTDMAYQSIEIAYSAATPTVLFGVSGGVFYINGYFASVQQQQIVPAITNRWCSFTVGLSQTQSIVDSDADSTLLDPAQGSYNYAAPGADRLKITLTLTAYEQDKVSDPNFIELMRVEEGIIIRQSKYSEYAELMSTIARRTYDESGNYVVNPFIISLKDEGVAESISAIINPGKAYVGGYEFETITPTKLQIGRALETETANNFMVDTYVGNYVSISTATGTIPESGTTVTIKEGTTTKGTAVFLQISSTSAGKKIFLSDISCVITTGMTFSVSTFTATASSGVIDTAYKNRVFAFPQAFIKSVGDVSYKTKRLFKNVTFTNGVATISGNNTNERFSGGTGVLSGAVTNEYYAILNTGANTTFTVTKPVVAANSIDQCQISLSNTSYNGFGDIIATIDVNSESTRVKTLNHQMVTLASVGTSSYVSLKYADLYKVRYASLLPTGGILSGEWIATSYVAKSVVSYNNVIYYTANAVTSTDVPGVSASWVKQTDLSSDLLVKDGQTDSWYDHASVKAKTTARTNLVVLFDYFSHSGSGLITVNSYPVAYGDIPSYTTSLGQVIELKDAIDSRPRRTNLSSNLVFDSFQVPDDYGVELSVEYYLARIDKIVLTNTRNFKVIQGVSSYNQPLPPADTQDAMTLAMLLIPPYTNDVKIIQIRNISNRRYTMRDIGLIDQRLGNVEYYTSINNLESSVLNSTQYAPNGTELFKAGFIADNFESFNVGNVKSPEYKCSIDTDAGVCRPQFKMGTIQLIEDTASSTTRKTGDLITLPYTTRTLIKNTNPTGYININPFNVLSNIGLAKISPSSDYWFSENTLPQINIVNENTDAFAVAQQSANIFNQQAQWNAWSTIWTGAQTSSSTSSSYNRFQVAGEAHGTYSVTTTNTTTLTDAIQSRSKAVQSISASNIINGDNTKLVSRETQPFIREKDISFVIDGMTPYTRLYAWIDDVNVNQHVTPATSIYVGTILSATVATQGSGYTTATINVIGDGTGAILTPVISDGKIVSITVTNPGVGYTANPTLTISGDGTGAVAAASIITPSKGAELYSDKFGHCEGILTFPDGQFTCGTHQISFTDSATENRSDTSEAITLYTAEGYINNNQRTVISTRIPQVVSGSISEQKSVVLTSTTSATRTVHISPHDPLAQSFFIEEQSGVFVHSVDVFFVTKDQSMPVIMELRPTNNGYPSSSIIIPFSVVTKYPENINISEDGTVATTFTFESPVYLAAGEYAIVLKSGSNKYQAFISEMSKPIIGTTKVISDQPYIGSLFESQNASTWSADQFKDLCFEMRVCEFTKASQTFVLKNSETGFSADVIHGMIQSMQPTNTSISAVVSLPSYVGNFIFDTDVVLPSQSTFNNVGDATITITMSTNDVNVTPVIDLERTALICIENIINKSTDIVNPETLFQNGDAKAKYVTSRVTLNQGFNASNLVVYVNVNRPQESSIEVYFRAKNEFDTTDLSGHAWTKLTQEINGGNTSQEGQFVEDKWSVYDYSYSTFNEFNTYEIKVVMYSTNTSKVPVLADIRAIALA
jgi:hypothetical protein